MKWCGLVGLILLGIPCVVSAQDRKPAHVAASWVVAQSPVCDHVLGRIVRRASDYDEVDPRLVPLSNAIVTIAVSGLGAQGRSAADSSVALTDTAGRFRLPLPKRTTTLEVKVIGYEPALVALDGNRYRAAVVEVTLGSTGFHIPLRGLTVVATRGLVSCAS